MKQNNPNHQHPLAIYFCGQEACGPAHSFGPAMRPHYLLHVIFHGEGIYQCGGHTYHLSAGDAFLIRPADSIYYRADDENPWSYAWAGFDGSACSEILMQTVFSDSLVFQTESASRKESLLIHMQTLVNSFEESNGNSLEASGNLLLVLSTMKKKPAESRNDIASLYFQKASEYIRNNYAYPIQISDVAHYVGIDRSYLYRIFMEQENISPKQYLLKYRLQMAAQLLCSSSCTITEVALSCGFRDAPSFCNYFRTGTGYTPKKFRRLYSGTMDTPPHSIPATHSLHDSPK